MSPKREPVAIMTAVLVGLQVITASAVLTDILGARVGGLIILAVAALNAGWGAYTRGQVTPVEDADEPEREKSSAGF